MISEEEASSSGKYNDFCWMAVSVNVEFCTKPQICIFITNKGGLKHQSFLQAQCPLTVLSTMFVI